MNICLATVHQHRTPLFTPLAVLYLKAFLVEARRQAASEIAIVEGTSETSADQLANAILATDPAVVGLSCYVWNIVVSMDACRRLKARRPDVRVVLGGPEVGPVAGAVLRQHPDVDAVVRSEGERPFAEIVDRWRTGASLAGVAGVSYRDGAEVVQNAEAAILKDLNQLPSPQFADFVDQRQRIVCLETQRGCVFRCNFCFYNKDYSIRNRRFSLERVREEILFWLRRDIRQLYLMDPVFNLNAERAKDICRFIAEHNDRRVPVHAEIWAEFVDEELAELMRRANFTLLEVGLQTTDATALSTSERRLRLEPFVRGIHYLRQAGLKFELQLIYGLPGETVSSFKESLNFAVRLNPPILAIFPLMVLPGTALWNTASSLSVEFDRAPPYFVRSHASMTREDVAYGWRLIDAVNELMASPTIRLLGRERVLSFSAIVDEWLAWKERAPEAPDRLRAFVEYLCATRDLPPDFYRSCAAWEWPEVRPTRA